MGATRGSLPVDGISTFSLGSGGHESGLSAPREWSGFWEPLQGGVEILVGAYFWPVGVSNSFTEAKAFAGCRPTLKWHLGGPAARPEHSRLGGSGRATRGEIDERHTCSADRSSKATLLLTVVGSSQVVYKGFMWASGRNSHQDGSTAQSAYHESGDARPMEDPAPSISSILEAFRC